MPRFVKKVLSQEMGISRSQLDDFLKRAGSPRPDDAKKYDIDEVRAFVAGQRDASYDGEDIKKLRAKKVSLECQRLQHEIETRKGLYIATSEILPVIAAFNSSLTANLRAKFEFELPSRYPGKSEIECQQINIEAIDFVLRALKSGQWSITSQQVPT